MPRFLLATFYILLLNLGPANASQLTDSRPGAGQSSVASTTVRGATPRTSLSLGISITRKAVKGQRDNFTLMAQAGQYFELLAEQKGADVVVEVLDPSGKSLLIADSQNGEWGPEPAHVIAEQSGQFHVRINTSDAEPGASYSLTLTTLRKAEPRDSDSLQLQAYLAKGAELMHQSHFADSLKICQQAATLATELGEQHELAMAETMEGSLLNALGQKQEAIDQLNQALRIETQSGERGEEAGTLGSIGMTYSGLNDNRRALQFLEEALAIDRDLNARSSEGGALFMIASIRAASGDLKMATEELEQSAHIAQELGDEAGEAGTRAGAANLYILLGERRKALGSLNRAVALYRRIGDHPDQRYILGEIGLAFVELNEDQNAMDCLSRAVTFSRQVGDKYSEAIALAGIGKVSIDQGDQKKALDAFDTVLQLGKETGNVAIQSTALSDLALLYIFQGDKQKALETLNQALSMMRQAGVRFGEAKVLVEIGDLNILLGQGPAALTSLNDALSISRQVGDRPTEAETLIELGYLDASLGENQAAINEYNQALSIQLKSGDRAGQALTLVCLSIAYSAMKNKEALGYGMRAWALSEELHINVSQVRALLAIGLAQDNLHQGRTAINFFYRALLICERTQDRLFEAVALDDLGHAYIGLGEYKTALRPLKLALAIASAAGFPSLKSRVLYNLMLAERRTRPAVAVFYGKEAVNLLQQLRQSASEISDDMQRSLVSSKESVYRDLADLLIDQERLPEAQQVLNLLKEQEYTDFVRGDSADVLGPLSLTPEERQAEEDYRSSTTQLALLGRQWLELKKIKARTPEEEKQYQKLSSRLETARGGLNNYFDRLYVLFGEDSQANKQVADVKRDVSALEDQIADTPNAVALYTIITNNRYRVIVITPATTVARESAISEQDLNRKISAFQQVLRNPSEDPKPLAQELYKILIGPIKADLDQADAKTLVWSLDGALRYIPMAALFDGRHYLVENYSMVAITPASFSRLGETPELEAAKAVAMGISRQYEADLSPLPEVSTELREIVKDPQVEGANGVLPGSILLNGQFTEEAMENQLDRGHPIVHIASHFVLNPGDDSQSYLLLAGKTIEGNGFHLTLADFRDNQNLDLRHTDLLTLSACETGVTGIASNGREVDGLATTAQLKGAKAVISSLWEVNDASTGELMADFYRRWKDGAGKVMKVEALRQAQLDLLLAKQTEKSAFDDRGLRFDHNGDQGRANLSHPYYWAPFVLMGNWR